MVALQEDWPLWIATIIAAVILVLLVVFAWLGRDLKTRRLRIGFFMERERFDKDDQ